MLEVDSENINSLEKKGMFWEKIEDNDRSRGQAKFGMSSSTGEPSHVFEPNLIWHWCTK